jgi:hypothetical protein
VTFEQFCHRWIGFRIVLYVVLTEELRKMRDEES